jgi:hypothetical protein
MYNGGKSILSAEKTKLLDAIGFPWRPAKSCGSSFMVGLRAYADAHAANAPLPEEWCNAQRLARAKGKLSAQRVSYLDKFGFDWIGEDAAAATDA